MDRIDRRFEKMLADPDQQERAKSHRDMLSTIDSWTNVDLARWIHGFNRYHKAFVKDTIAQFIALNPPAAIIRDTFSVAWPALEILSEQDWLLPTLRKGGFFTDARGVQAPTAPVTVYRGCPIGYEQRLSWTTSMRLAELFAIRNQIHSGSLGRIIKVTAPASAVLGFLQHEMEVLLDYKEISKPTLIFELIDTAPNPRLISLLPGEDLAPW